MRYSLETRSFMAHALKDLKKSDNVLSLSEKSIFHKLSLSALNFNSQMNAKKLENDQYVMYKMNLSNIPNILIMNLAYHIYNLEFSNFKPWILSLTPEISNFLTSMTAYEYNTFIKSNKEMNPFIKDYFDSFEKDWKNLDYFIKKKMTSEERQSFFNGHTFTKTDYLFAISVTERHIWPKDDEKELILFPGNDNFPRKNEEKSYEDYFKQQEVQPLGNQSMHFKFRADRNISKGGFIYQSFIEPRSYLSVLLYGNLPKPSHTDCINTEVFFYEDIFGISEKRKQLLQWAAESGVICLNLNPYIIARLKIVGTILNMNTKELDECYALLSSSDNKRNKYGLFFDNCANPEWKNMDPRKNPLKSLNASLTYFEDNHARASVYLKNRKDYGKEWKNAQLLFDYTEEKTNLAKKLMDKIKNLTPNRALLEEIENDDNEKSKENFTKEDQKIMV